MNDRSIHSMYFDESPDLAPFISHPGSRLWWADERPKTSTLTLETVQRFRQLFDDQRVTHQSCHLFIHERQIGRAISEGLLPEGFVGDSHTDGDTTVHIHPEFVWPTRWVTHRDLRKMFPPRDEPVDDLTLALKHMVAARYPAPLIRSEGT